MPVSQGFLKYQLPALAWAILIFIASSFPGSTYPEVNIAGIDKFVHFTIYATLCLFTYNAIRHQLRFPFLSRHAMIFSLVLTTLYGLSDEMHQLAVPGRSCDAWDLAADTLGGLVCLTIVWIYGRLTLKRRIAAEK